MSEEKANQRVEEFKREMKTLTVRLKEAENRAESAEKQVKRLQKEVDRLEGICIRSKWLAYMLYSRHNPAEYPLYGIQSFWIVIWFVTHTTDREKMASFRSDFTRLSSILCRSIRR